MVEHRDFRCARLTVTAAGLGRRTIDEPGRLPSDRPGPCGPSGLCHTCCSRAWHRPAPCRLPRSRSASSKAGGSLQAIPSLPAHAGVTPNAHPGSEKDASLRLLQPTPLHEHPADCSIPGFMLVMPRLAARHPHTTARPGPKAERWRGWDLDAIYRTNQPGEASLDGEPPASASAATRYLVISEVWPRSPCTPDPAQSWRSHDRWPLCAEPPGPGVFGLEPSMRRSI